MKEGLKRFALGAADCTSAEIIPFAAIVSGTDAAKAFESGHHKEGALATALTAGLLICDWRDRIREKKAAFRTGAQMGLEAGYITAQAVEVFASSTDPDKPLYKSLNGETTYTALKEIFDDVGDPDIMTIRLGVIVAHAKSGPLQEGEIETLRKIKSARSLIPGGDALFCEKGQKMITEADKLVADFENTYKEQHPQD